MKSETEGPATAPLRTVRAAMGEANRFLGQRGIESARLDAEVLLRHVLEMDKTEFYVSIDFPLTPHAEERLWKLLRRRGRREPLAYITGRKEFWSHEFAVTPDVLIPRPETELLLEVALQQARPLRGKSPLNILDVGTGSGAIAVCLAKEIPEAQISAVDISAAALNLARLNGEHHGVAGRIHFAQGDLFAPLAGQGKSFDLIVSNPPYVRHRDLAELAPEIRDWEPVIALDGGEEGLELYRRIVGEAANYIADGGFMALEIGDRMAEAVLRLFSAAGTFEPASVYRDYAGKERVVAARRIGLRG